MGSGPEDDRKRPSDQPSQSPHGGCSLLDVGAVRRVPGSDDGCAASVIAAVARLMPKPLLTPDQLILLKSDNVVNDALLGFDALGLTPMPIEAILPDYLARYRPQGKKPA